VIPLNCNGLKKSGMNLTSGDADALDALWADDMEVAVPKMPVMQRADVLKFARSGRMKFFRYQTSDTRIRLYDNAAVVTGRLKRTRSMNGAGNIRRLAFHEDLCAPSRALARIFISCLGSSPTVGPADSECNGSTGIVVRF
jgi:hypothetical protein